MKMSLKQLLTLAAIALTLATGLLLLRFESLETNLQEDDLAQLEAPGVDPTALPFDPSTVAAAYRDGDFDRTRALLEAAAAQGEEEVAREADLLLGLYAYASDRPQLAVSRLEAVESTDLPLGDWRLFALADALRSQDRPNEARARYAELVEKHPESPLVERAAVEAARLAWRLDEDALGALDLLNRARRNGPQTAEIDEITWKIGRDSGDSEVEREAARMLLVHAPLRARKLEVASVFTDAEGRITSWDGILSPAQVRERAANWIELGQGSSAKATLGTVAEADRNEDWDLLQAQAWLLTNQPQDAYKLLDGIDGRTEAETAQVEWLKARAAAELATPSRKDKVSKVSRQRYARRAEEHLRNVIALGASKELTAKAARQLVPDLVDADRVDSAVELLRLLRKLDEGDRTGAPYLWERGWQEYQRKNYTGAIAYWTELEDIYPDDFNGHRGRYWKARALDALGNEDRARALYARVVQDTDTTDFYVRQAQQRLGAEGIALAASSPKPGDEAPWPTDPALQRVELLMELGLDALADNELALLGPEVDQREVQALEGMMMVRQGEPRSGIQLLKTAYPNLGSAYQGRVPREVLRAYYPLHHADAIRRYSEEAGVQPEMVAGIIRQESAFDTRATSHVGARGLMQLMPATAKEWSGKLDEPYSPERLYNPEVSVRLGANYFRWVLDRFDGNVELALAGYNGGPNRIRRLWNEEGPEAELDLFLESLKISESQTYVRRIVLISDSYRQLYPEVTRG
jgi:soluble lytic murein transglycosylase-like protein